MAYCRYGRVCRYVKLRISMIHTFSFGNNSHITLYAQLEIVWKVSKVLRKYWGKYGQNKFMILECVMPQCMLNFSLKYTSSLYLNNDKYTAEWIPRNKKAFAKIWNKSQKVIRSHKSHINILKSSQKFPNCPGGNFGPRYCFVEIRVVDKTWSYNFNAYWEDLQDSGIWKKIWRNPGGIHIEWK